MNHEDIFESLTRNAFDFLERGIAEFDASPKYSVIHFCAAVEMLLKARLMKEHLRCGAEVDHRILGRCIKLRNAALQEVEGVPRQRLEDVLVTHGRRSARSSSCARSRLMLVTAQSGSCVKGRVT